MFRSRIAIVALAASAALVAGAGAASASPPPQPKATTAVTFITDRPDSGNGGYWADDTFDRVLVITRTGGTAGAWTFDAKLTDQGTFTTIKGAEAPNQGGYYAGDVIKAAVTGIMAGWAYYTFTASALPSSSLVPGYENDHGAVPSDSTSTWYELAFPAGTTFGGAGIGPWSWFYGVIDRAGFQAWTDGSGNNYGDSAGDGQITG